MSKTRRVSGPSASAMRELVGRFRYSLIALLRAETRADANVELHRLDQSLRHWSAVYLPATPYAHQVERTHTHGKPTTDQPPTVEAASVKESEPETDEVDRGELPLE